MYYIPYWCLIPLRQFWLDCRFLILLSFNLLSGTPSLCTLLIMGLFSFISLLKFHYFLNKFWQFRCVLLLFNIINFGSLIFEFFDSLYRLICFNLSINHFTFSLHSCYEFQFLFYYISYSLVQCTFINPLSNHKLLLYLKIHCLGLLRSPFDNFIYNLRFDSLFYNLIYKPRTIKRCIFRWCLLIINRK